MSMEWLKPFEKEGVHWNADNMQWEFPSGAIVGFGYLASDADKYRYIGQAYQFIGFDELTQQPWETYSFLFSRLVRNKAQAELGIPLRYRSTTNPNGAYVDWVYNRFVNKKSRIQIKNEIVQTAAEMGINPNDITDDYIRYRMPIFVPSLGRDNPHLDFTSYRESLNKLDIVTRKQLADGNWEIRAMGNMFSREWFEKIPLSKVPIFDLKTVRYWDMAATRKGDATASCLMGYDKKQGVFFVLDMKILHMTPRELEREVYLCCIDDGPKTTVYMEREPGSGGYANIDNYKRKVIPPGWRFLEDKPSGDKEARARPLSAAVEKGLIKIAWNNKTDKWFDMAMAQFETFPEGEHDDIVDATSGAFNALNKSLHSGLAYIGKVDWLMPIDENDGNGKKEKGPDDPLLKTIRGRMVA